MLLSTGNHKHVSAALSMRNHYHTWGRGAISGQDITLWCMIVYRTSQLTLFAGGYLGNRVSQQQIWTSSLCKTHSLNYQTSQLFIMHGEGHE